MSKIFILCLLFHSITPYYQIQLFRTPATPTPSSTWPPTPCPTTPNEQPCYYKDISYNLHLYHSHSLYSLSADLTSPLSWLKSPSCKTNSPTPSKCTLIQQPLLAEFKSTLSSLRQSILTLKRHQTKIALTQHNETTTGTLQTVKGIFEKNKQLSFWTVDSNRYVSLLKILGVGFFMEGEKDEIKLSHTNFVNATVVDGGLNRLCDGAVSLRFDPDSESSFLNEIFGAIDEVERTVTVFVDRKSVLTLGEVSTKHVAGGDEGINWIHLEETNNSVVTSSVGIGDEKQQKQLKKGEFPTYFTLSASYISLPPQLFTPLLSKLAPYNCTKTLNSFISCSHINKQFLSINLILTIQNIQILYPLTLLSLPTKHTTLTLNLRESDSNIIILGEPHFKSYFSVFDYKRNMIGLGHKFIIEEDTVVTSIVMVRFMVFCFVLACLLVVLSKPIKGVIKVVKRRLDGKGAKGGLGADGERRGIGRRVHYGVVPEENQQLEEF